MAVSAYAEVGSRDNPAGRAQIKDSAGRYIAVVSDAKTRKVSNNTGEELRVFIPGVK